MDFSSVDRALQSLQRRKPALDDEVIEVSKKLLLHDQAKDYREGILILLQKHADRWESLAVGLYVATDWLERIVVAVVDNDDSNKNKTGGKVYVEGPRVPSIRVEEQQQELKENHNNDLEQVSLLCGPLLESCKEHLEHSEPRVRTLVAKAVGAHAKLTSTLLKDNSELQQQRNDMHETICKSLYEHLDAGRDDSKKYSQSSTGALDDTTGWRALETNWQALASFIAACGPSIYLQQYPPDSNLYKALEYSCIDHVNRHVRAAGINVLEQLILVVPDGEQMPDSLKQTVTSVLKVTLADNWSQVRMAASVLCRTFLLALQNNNNNLPSVLPVLLPRMCLNRFYLAQGVKLYSHETWQLVFSKGQGIEYVSQYAGAVCRYYVQMCDADNHVVREAACQAVAELAKKLGSHKKYSDSLEPYVPMLLQALIMCFHDESWPVRDEACLACGTFCKAYPEACRPELSLLLEKWTSQLTDQIWSVRQDAAVALGDALDAYPELLQKELIPLLQKQLPSAKDQPAMTKEDYVKHQNDIESHTDSQLYSCGSLAPKLQKKAGAGRIGCSSCGINRPKAPWEATDGCIYLLRELVCKHVLEDDATLLPLFETMLDACRVRHFPQADDLRATLFRQLPIMANAMGKQRFKRYYLELVLDLVMSTLSKYSSASALSVHAAGQCAEELANLVGVSIFKGRLNQEQLQDFEQTMMERQHAPKGPMDTGNPFGPGVPMEFRAPPAAAAGSPFGQPPTVAGNSLTETL